LPTAPAFPAIYTAASAFAWVAWWGSRLVPNVEGSNRSSEWLEPTAELRKR
jgi:hypothetical protein